MWGGQTAESGQRAPVSHHRVYSGQQQRGPAHYRHRHTPLPPADGHVYVTYLSLVDVHVHVINPVITEILKREINDKAFVSYVMDTVKRG